MTDPQLEDLYELRLALAEAELEKRWRLRQPADTKRIMDAFERCQRLQNAIFYAEAAMRFREIRESLLPPRRSSLHSQPENPN